MSRNIDHEYIDANVSPNQIPPEQSKTIQYENNKFRHSNIVNKKQCPQLITSRQGNPRQEMIMGCTGPLDYYDNPGKNGFGGRFSRKFEKHPNPVGDYGRPDLSKSVNPNLGGGMTMGGDQYNTNYDRGYNAPRAMSNGRMDILHCNKTHDNFFSKEGKRHITKGGFPLLSTYQAYFSSGTGSKKQKYRPLTNDGKTIIYKKCGGIGGAHNENYFYEERMLDRDPFNENNFPPEVSRRFNPRYFPRVPYDRIPKMYRWAILGAYTPKNGKTFHKTQIFNNFKPYLVNEFGEYGEPMD